MCSSDLPFISKRLDFPNIDPNNFADAVWNTYANGPRIHEFLKEINREVLQHYDVTTVAEGIGVTPQQALDYVGEEARELDMLYHFDHMMINYGDGGKYDPKGWTLPTFKAIFNRWQQAMGEAGWVTIFLDNHDFPRMVSRFATDNPHFHRDAAKLLATLLLTMRGTPCIYQGSEIGMTNIKMEKLEDFDDVEIKNYVAEMRERGENPAEMIPIFNQMGRDNARTPMQWSAGKNAGFTEGEPWLKVNPNYPKINVEAALADEDSIFYFYQKMIQLRQQYPTLIYGDYEDLFPESKDIFAYRRKDADGNFVIALNFSDIGQYVGGLTNIKEEYVLIRNCQEEYSIALYPWEARVYKLS